MIKLFEEEDFNFIDNEAFENNRATAAHQANMKLAGFLYEVTIMKDALKSIAGIDLGNKKLIQDAFADDTKTQLIETITEDILLAREVLFEINKYVPQQ